MTLGPLTPPSNHSLPLPSECNSETSENGTYFTNPMSLSSVCSLMIRPMADDICQVRLDLETFNLVDPDVTGNCRTDYMQVPTLPCL